MKAAPAIIRSIPELRKAIKEADLVLGMVRFGTLETSVKIAKKEALYLIAGLEDTATPEDLSMFGDSFGSLEIDDTTKEMVLYLG